MINIEIIYENDELLVVNKPAGIMIHGDGRYDEKTVADWIIEKYPEVRGIGEMFILRNGTEINRSGIVHRLDKETSGVLVVAKTHDAFQYLKQQFQERQIKKTYRAIVHGTVKNDSGVIDKPIGKSRSDFRKWSAEYGARGILRDAVTEYKVLSRGTIKSCGSLTSTGSGEVRLPQDFNGGIKVTHLEVYPKTGRTHQIRVHLKAIGHPVLCDTLYAAGKPCPPELGRLALHAASLELTAPSGETLRLEASLPDDFAQTIDLIT